MVLPTRTTLLTNHVRNLEDLAINGVFPRFCHWLRVFTLSSD